MYNLGWSDIALFAIFENGHHAADQVWILDETNSKKWWIKLNISKHFLLGPQNERIGCRRNTNYFEFLFILNFYKYHSPLAQAPKKF